MTSPLDLCRGMTKTIYNSVVEVRGKSIVETRGVGHPIYQHERDAEKAGLHFLQTESKRHPKLKIGLGFELSPKWYAIEEGVIGEMDVTTLKEFEPDVCILSDPIDGSKADIPVYQSRFNKPIQDGEIFDAFSTAIAFHYEKPTLNNAVTCAIQRWDGRQYFADQYESLVDWQGEPAVIKAEYLDEIGLNTKFNTGGHYGHAASLATLVIETLLEELNIPENISPGVRSTGSTTCDMLQPPTTRSIAFDIRHELGKELEKYGTKMRRGAYTHDVAPPAFFGKNAGAVVLDLNEKELNFDLFEYEKTSYFEAPPGEAGKKVYRILREKVLPQLPEKVEQWKKFWAHA